MSALNRFCPVLVTLGLALGCSSEASAQLTVFDPETYSANLLIDAHALQQITNQVRQLQNEAQMLQRLEQNLQRLGVTIAPDLQRALADLVARLRDAEGTPLRLNGAQSAYDQLFPKQREP